MSRKAILDIGSNSVKLLVAEPAGDGTIRPVVDRCLVTRLGEGLESGGLLRPEAMARTVEAVEVLCAQAREVGAEQTLAVGTMALRSAANREDFLFRVRRAGAPEVVVLSGEQEARLSYLAVLSALPVPPGEWVVFDTGGGSTEFTFSRGPEVERRLSVNLGSVGLTQTCFPSDPVPPSRLAAAREQMDRDLAAAGVCGHPVQVIGLGGTVTALGAVRQQQTVFDPALLRGTVLTLAEIRAQIDRYSACSLAERRTIPGLPSGRAEVILAGACLVERILLQLQAQELTVCERGVRHGLALALFRDSAGSSLPGAAGSPCVSLF